MLMRDIVISFSTFFFTTWIVTYALYFWVRKDWNIQRPIRSTMALSFLVAFIGLNMNLTPMATRWIESKLPAPTPPALTAEETLKLKNEFLTNLEKFMAQPEQITPQARNDLFTRFAALWPQPQADLGAYFNNIAKFYDCQQAFYEDALQAMKTKKVAMSDKRKECYDADGSFFNRAKMIPETQAKADSEVVELLAHGKKIMKDGKEVPVNEDLIKRNIASQQKNKEVLRALFTGQ